MGSPGTTRSQQTASRLARRFLLRGRSVQLTSNRCRIMGFAHTFICLRGTETSRAPNNTGLNCPQVCPGCLPATVTCDAFTSRRHHLLSHITMGGPVLTGRPWSTGVTSVNHVGPTQGSSCGGNFVSFHRNTGSEYKHERDVAGLRGAFTGIQREWGAQVSSTVLLVWLLFRSPLLTELLLIPVQSGRGGGPG